MDILNVTKEIGKKLTYYQLRVSTKRAPHKPTKPIHMGKKLVILGNGPSNQSFIERAEELHDYEILCMNYFPVKSRELFLQMKPSYIALCDGVLWKEGDYISPEIEKTVQELHEILEKDVTWKIKIIAPITEKFHFKNKNIDYVHMNINEYYGNKTTYLNRYQCNQAIPGTDNVGMFSIYFAITFGFKYIELFGLENNSILSLENVKGSKFRYDIAHYYYATKLEIDASELGTWFIRTGVALDKHKCFADYAQSMNVQIKNCSPGSLLTIYNREI